MAPKTLRRNMDWHDEESLCRSVLHVNPPKVNTKISPIKISLLLFSIVYRNLGSILSSQGKLAEAEEAFIQALRYRPNIVDVL
ncbi:hypothetical protein HCN44_010977 [Aphidius gifuensis]|uniref:Uncharacterized protein n=1 Tax=Aphidius gifuensis TaxID=684658 RepID=A0A835CWP5_APHGI|nr:hypothetical protein HCN44_010977 [Aphidius gifuensis]